MERHESCTSERCPGSTSSTDRGEKGVAEHTIQHMMCVLSQILDSKERELQNEWERRESAEARAGLLMENEIAKQRTLMKKQIAEENKELQEEQTAR